MIFPQGFFEWVVQLLWAQFLTLLEVEFHQFIVDLYDLVDEPRMGVVDV